MKKSRQIQFGLMGLLSLVLAAYLFGGFTDAFKPNDKSQEARQDLTTSPKAVNVVNKEMSSKKVVANEPTAPAGPLTSMSIDETTFDYGTIQEGDIVEHTFTFTNTGSEPLVVSNAKSTCGCTVPKWTKAPIPPGGTGKVDVVFKSKGKKGKQSKPITLTANTSPAQSIFRITGEVTPDPNKEKEVKPKKGNKKGFAVVPAAQ